jgi:chromosome segregation ATPase
MTKKQSEGNSEKAPAYPELEKARAKLGGVVSQLREVDSKLEAALAEKREFDTARDSILARAEILLEGGEALPERDLSGEIRNLNEQREILRKAIELQQAKVDEAARAAALAEYRRLKPSFILAVKKLMGAVAEYRAAVEAMEAIRGEMASQGLPCALPPGITFPGWTVQNFEQRRETLAYRLRMAGLETNLK